MNANSPDLIVIGASWGGLAAITRILNLLPRDFPIPIVIAQHQHPDSAGNMVQVLRSKTKLNICDIEGITEILEHRVYVIPPNYHGLIENRHIEIYYT